MPGPDGALSPSSPAGCRLPARGWQATLGPVHGAMDTDCRPEAPSQGRRGTSQSATRALLSWLSGKRKASCRVPPGWEGAPGPLLLRACRPPARRAASSASGLQSNFCTRGLQRTRRQRGKAWAACGDRRWPMGTGSGPPGRGSPPGWAWQGRVSRWLGNRVCLAGTPQPWAPGSWVTWRWLRAPVRFPQAAPDLVLPDTRGQGGRKGRPWGSGPEALPETQGLASPRRWLGLRCCSGEAWAPPHSARSARAEGPSRGGGGRPGGSLGA